MAEKLAVGRELWRWVGTTMLRYKVIGVREYADSLQYEVSCLSCRHDDTCRVLIAYDDNWQLQTVHLLTEDEELRDMQSCWHANDPGYSTPYCISENDARIWRLKMATKRARDRLTTLNEAAARAITDRDGAKTHLEEMEHALEMLTKEAERPNKKEGK